MRFDVLVESLLNEATRCTGPTKKAHSSRKGKKWMKCVKFKNGRNDYGG